jgi:hypothetical protein
VRNSIHWRDKRSKADSKGAFEVNPQLIVARAAEIEIALLQSGGELTPELEIAMRAIAEDVDATSMTLERAESAAAYWKEQARKANAVAKGLSAFQERLEATIKGLMQEKGMNELLGDSVRFKLSPCAKRLVIDEARLDPGYRMQVVTMLPDKARLKEELEAGATITGASLEGGTSLRIYPNRTALPK